MPAQSSSKRLSPGATLPSASVVLLPRPGNANPPPAWRATGACKISLQRPGSQLAAKQYEFRGGVRAFPTDRHGTTEAQRWLVAETFRERIRQTVRSAGQLCIWLHGPRGAGKSALAWGDVRTMPWEGCGIAGDVGSLLFEAMRNLKTSAASAGPRHKAGADEQLVTMQFVKIGSETELCGDCLQSPELNPKFRVRDPRPGCGLSLEGLSEVELSSTDDLYAALRFCRDNLAAAGTYPSGRQQAVDPRAHGLCTFRARRCDAFGSIHTATIHVLDLVGAEASGSGANPASRSGSVAPSPAGRGSRGGKSGGKGRVAEDRSLKAVLRVVGSMAESVDYHMRDGRSVPRHIPYRDSKLTRLVSECFGGCGRSVLLGLAGQDAATAGGPGHDAALTAFELAALHERGRDGGLEPDVFDRRGRLSALNAEAEELAGDLSMGEQFAAGMGPQDLRLGMDSPDDLVKLRDLLEERRRVEAAEDWSALRARTAAEAAKASWRKAAAPPAKKFAKPASLSGSFSMVSDSAASVVESAAETTSQASW